LKGKMINNNDALILIEKLKKKTELKQIIWNRTNSSNEFKLELNQTTITIDSWYSDDDSSFHADLCIINEHGDFISRFVFDESDENYSKLKNVHDLAKRQYYKVDEVLKDIINELDSDKVIGKPDPKDDLPF